VHLPGASALRVCLDNRTWLSQDEQEVEGNNTSLMFWRCKADALRGDEPVYRIDSGCTDRQGYRSFVIGNASRLYYIFRTDNTKPTLSRKTSLSQQRLLRLEATNNCNSDFKVREGNTIDSVRCFPSVAAMEVLLACGKWYYEVTIVRAGLAQVGWADTSFTGQSSNGNGCGDDLHSWGYDGLRAMKWHGSGIEWGRKWSEGDVVGVLANLDERTVSFSINGDESPPMGVAFQNIVFNDGIRPCVTLNSTASIALNFGEKPLQHLPTGYKPVSMAPRNSVMLAKNWGYMFEVAPFIRIQTRPVCDFDALWAPRKQSKAASIGQCTLWRPTIPPGCAIFGDIFSPSSRAPAATLVVIDDIGNPFLAPPTGYKKLWHESSTSAPFYGTLWRPSPPEGFVSLGDVYTKTPAEPPISLVRCIHQDCVAKSAVLSQLQVHRAGKSANNTPSRNTQIELWSIKNQLRTFVVLSGAKKNLPEVSPKHSIAPEVWSLKHFSPNTTHLVWETEDAVFYDGSVFWASWVLSTLKTEPELSVCRKSANLRPIFSELLDCLTSMMCSPKVKEEVATSLIRLLQEADSDQLAGLDLQPLHTLSKKIIDLSWVTRKDAQLILPRALTTLLELALTTFAAEERAGLLQESVPDDSEPTIHQPLVGAPPLPLGSPTLVPLLVNTVEMVDYFLDFRLHRHQSSLIRPLPLNQKVLNSWISTAAFMISRQYTHPKKLPKHREHIEIPGAQSLELVFDRRCNLTHKLSFKFRTAPVCTQQAKVSAIAKGKAWRFDSPHGDRRWDIRPQFTGDRVKCSVKNELDASASQPENLGIFFTVVAREVPLHVRRHKFRCAQTQPKVASEVASIFEGWTQEMDALLVEWVNDHCAAAGASTLTMSPLDFRPTPDELEFHYKPLRAAPTSTLCFRLRLIQELNKDIQQLLPVIDLLGTNKQGLGFKLRSLSYLIFRQVKEQFLDLAKQRTTGIGGSATTVTLDNFLATRSSDTGANPSIEHSRCIFVQAFHALKDKESKVLRSCYDGDRVFQVTFKGEKGSDAGGLFRDAMSQIVEDLFSPKLDLLIPCPNAVHEVFMNIDKYIPNPRYHHHTLGLSMFCFVGRLLGVSLRAQLCLPFRLPSAVWKYLVGEQLNFNEDIAGYDALVTQLVKDLRQSEQLGVVDESSFNEKYADTLTFVCSAADGLEVELIPQGSQHAVTFDNKEEYCTLVESYKIAELAPQLNALAKGMAEIVPRCATSLFTWHELEKLVCGSPHFDLDFWREHTTYRGYTEDDPTIELFWQVLGSLSTVEQEGFVRFAWGRSRLPPKGSWYKDMQISRRNTSETSLPVSHTCFFSIELPPYQTEEQMRHGLQTAIHFGVGGILNT